MNNINNKFIEFTKKLSKQNNLICDMVGISWFDFTRINNILIRWVRHIEAERKLKSKMFMKNKNIHAMMNELHSGR